jgi:RNA polymerase sigma factor (sigma-70 family)
MGGMSSKLPETRPSLILAACTRDEARRNIAITNLTNAYWKPVYCYFRRHGYRNEEAKDLTQEFFTKFILDGKLLQSVDRQIGRFRQLLTTALKRFIINTERDKNRKKRTPEGGVASLASAESESNDIDPPSSEATPEQAFYYTWITDLLDYAIAETKRQCHDSGLRLHWQVFHRKVLAPILEDAKDTSMKEICRMYGVESEDKANNMIVTAKRRFQKILKQRLRDLVRSDSLVDSEFDDILGFLSENSARL